MKSVETENATKPNVLVLMATYNGAKWLVEQMESVLNQCDVNVHVLVGDDRSSDETGRLIAEHWASDNRVKYRVWCESSGSAGANFRRLIRNTEVEGYDFVALADQDDIWEPRKLACAIEKLMQSGAHGYSCAVRSFWPDGSKKILPQVAVPRHADFLFEGAGQGCTFTIRSELFARVRDYCIKYSDETEALHYHDWLLYLLARAWGYKWYFDQEPWVNYRQHGGNEIGSRGGLRAVTKRLELIRKGWFGAQVAAALKLFTHARSGDQLITTFSQIFTKPDSVVRRARLCCFVVQHGRRRFSDRLVLAVSAAAGWI